MGTCDKNVVARVIATVQRCLDNHELGIAIGLDDDLRELGISSIQVIDIILGLEEEFGIQIDDRAITPVSVGSVRGLYTLMERSLT